MKVYILIFFSFITISPILNYIGLSKILLLLLAVGYIIFEYFKQKNIRKDLLCFIFIYITLCIFTAAYWINIHIFYVISTFIASLLIVYIHKINIYYKYIDIISVIVITLIIGAWVGFVYAYLGGDSIYSIVNPDGRENKLYLTTFTNSKFANVIRPAGIFDEPGAFSFVICLIAAIRTLINKDTKVTWFMLITGLITFSLAHLVYIIFHFASEKLTIKKVAYLIPLLIVIMTVYKLSPLEEVVNITYVERLTVVDGELVGDNRSERTLTLAGYMSQDIPSIMWGINDVCINIMEMCVQRYGYVGATVLTPIFRYGILVSLPYYMLIAFLLYRGIGNRKKYFLIGIALLLMQRPYLFASGYAMLMLIPFYIEYNNENIDNNSLL